MEAQNNQITVGSVVVHVKRPINNPPQFIVKSIDGCRCTLQCFKDMERIHYAGNDAIGTYDINDLVFVEQRDIYKFKFIGYKDCAYIRLDKPIVKEFDNKQDAEDYFNT